MDKNPLTVELAKVSLWLHSFTVGAPLSFLDHHLRCGDSLVGLRVSDATRDLARLGGMYSGSAIQAAENAAEGMRQIEQMSDADVAEVRESASLFQGIEEATSELRGVLDTLCGVGWLTAGMKSKERTGFEAPLVGTLALREDRAYQLIARRPRKLSMTTTRSSNVPSGRALKGCGAPPLPSPNGKSSCIGRRPYPGVWRRWQDEQPVGGFDAVIGNPPWDRIKLQEVEWFATRAPWSWP